jgi:hypothetical protein
MSKKPALIGLIQSLFLAVYVGLVSLLIWGGENSFTSQPGILNVALVLTLFATSALVSAVITLGYPAYVFIKKQNLKEAVSIVTYTIVWLVLLIGTLYLVLTS